MQRVRFTPRHLRCPQHGGVRRRCSSRALGSANSEPADSPRPDTARPRRPGGTPGPTVRVRMGSARERRPRASRSRAPLRCAAATPGDAVPPTLTLPPGTASSGPEETEQASRHRAARPGARPRDRRRPLRAAGAEPPGGLRAVGPRAMLAEGHHRGGTAHAEADALPGPAAGIPLTGATAGHPEPCSTRPPALRRLLGPVSRGHRAPTRTRPPRRSTACAPPIDVELDAPRPRPRRPP